MTILELFFVCPNECSTLHWWTKQKLYRQFGGVLCGHASIIMLLKVAAMVDKVAADLCFRASKVRWLLPEKYFDFAATSAACLCVPLYIIVLPYFRHFGSFAPKIGEFRKNFGI